MPSEDLTGLPAYRRYLGHLNVECTCHRLGPGWVASTVQNWGDRWTGTDCSKGHELWLAVKAEMAVRLTDFWEAVTLYPGTEVEAWENSDLTTCLGVHLYCNGFMDVKRVAEPWNAIVCRECHLRVMVPVTVKTVAQLRQWSIIRFSGWTEAWTEEDEALAELVRQD